MKPFGIHPNGETVQQITLRSGTLECDILTYGGALRALRCPDKNGGITDILLGFDTLEDYMAQVGYIGALIGRYANRIGGSQFALKGTVYPLCANDGPNHLHGGAQGFDRRIWTVEAVTDKSLCLSLVSPHGDEGYPGTLSVQVCYTLEEQALSISYRASTDRDTLCNLTNHAYFNLAGHASGPVLDQEIQIFAPHYTPCGPGSIPTGQIARVEGSPMDLRSPAPIGRHLLDDFPQLRAAGGYDHNWCLSGNPGLLRPAARAYSPQSGIRLDVETTLPGIQFYSGNYLQGCPQGKGGAPYGKHWGFCLETQYFPDTPHHENFPCAILEAGEEHRSTTVYRISLA